MLIKFLIREVEEVIEYLRWKLRGKFGDGQHVNHAAGGDCCVCECGERKGVKIRSETWGPPTVWRQGNGGGATL